LTINPGTDLVLCTADDYSSLDLATGTGNVLGTIYNEQEILSRPSISDDGKQAVFVNKAGDIIYVTFEYVGGNITPTLQVLSQNPEWRNAAISKDGERVAALSDANDNIVYLFDLFTADGAEFTLYNPTYTQGETTSDVAYADVMDFDYSGDYIMYDSYNNLQNNQGQDLSYWDIGFIQIRENGSYVNNADVYISKLFSGLPEKTNVGNPTFSKNSPYIIAFDLYDELNNRNDIIAANSETGDYNVLVQDVGDYSWPNYDREDKNIIFHSASSASAQRIYKQGVNSTKIQPQGGTTNFIDNHVWGVWFANGSRSLVVDTKSPALQQMDIAPNPTTAMVWIAGFSADVARFEVFDLLGRRLAVVPTAGTERVGIDVSAYTNGVYHLVAYTAQGALLGSAKIIKE
jgi:bacillolysin